ncbi:VanZ family protein [Nocardioides lianchengensis]|uniref:VanZ like family protein n=1 Tax=Nocardioides lianchengensis TaxID=1045774 RepID=A0A1G6JWN7_9ACTN|nr:VanZ family protein [Nocardioides lianchengensis]NYG08785.1 hypothetical protein [Nocardioides lianchengensis]SDC22416.1 VanZ like family protein [Nocardioides lianchengensis]
MLDDEVWRHLPLAPIPAVLVGVVGLALLVAVSTFSGRGAARAAAVLATVTVGAILVVTLTGGATSDERTTSLRPGAGIRLELGNVNQTLGLVNVLGNIALFIPLVWSVAALALQARTTGARTGLALGGLAGLALSVSLEVAQYFLGRAADVDDVLLNATGALLGAAGSAVLIMIVRPDRRRARP